jgi:chitinase
MRDHWQILPVLTHQIEWVGSGPFCASGSAHATCPSDYPAEDTYSLYGAGGESVCLSGKSMSLFVINAMISSHKRSTGYKSFCCSKPDPYTGCAW